MRMGKFAVLCFLCTALVAVAFYAARVGARQALLTAPLPAPPALYATADQYGRAFEADGRVPLSVNLRERPSKSSPVVELLDFGATARQAPGIVAPTGWVALIGPKTGQVCYARTHLVTLRERDAVPPAG